jgi:hypothetical protein
MLDFPASPTVGQQFTAAGVTWIWDGAKWLPSGLSPTVAPGINDNRLINGDMRIDQRNGGASGTAIGYMVDRWQISTPQASKFTWGQNLNVVVGPVGFPYYLGLQSSSAYTPLATDYFGIAQAFEADMISDFAWGTANAQPVTLSFWARSSLTGTFGGCLANVAGTRGYPFTFSLPTANTWTKIAITIPGDTAGTWVMQGNAGSLSLWVDLGAGASLRAAAGAWHAGNFVGATGSVSVVAVNGATFYVTGVKLEIGSVATPYNRQSLAKSMADCQRYYQVFNSAWISSGYTPASVNVNESYTFQIMRAVPTVTFFNVVYNNSSGIQSFSTQSNCVSVAVAATAAGAASANFACTLAAEL